MSLHTFQRPPQLLRKTAWISWVFLLALFAPTLAAAKPKLGPEALPLSHTYGYFQNSAHPAWQFWRLIPYYAPQKTGSSCSVASVTLLLNALRSQLPLTADDPLVSEELLLQRVKNPIWARASGVTLDELAILTQESLRAYELAFTQVHAVHADPSHPKVQASLHQDLLQLTQTPHTYLLANFLQGAYTGDANIGHVSPVGAYDPVQKKVLILDVDREYYEPYWVSEETFFKGMATLDEGAKQNRGYVLVKVSPVKH